MDTDEKIFKKPTLIKYIVINQLKMEKKRRVPLLSKKKQKFDASFSQIFVQLEFSKQIARNALISSMAPLFKPNK